MTEHDKNWYLPTRVKSLEGVFSREFVAPADFIGTLGLRERQVIFETRPKSLVLFNKPIVPESLGLKGTELCWIRFGFSFIEKTCRKEDIETLEAPYPMLLVNAPLLLCLNQCKFLFHDSATLEKARCRTSVNPTVKLTGKYRRSFEIAQNVEKRDGPELAEEAEESVIDKDAFDKYEEKIKSLNRRKGRDYAALIGKKFFYDEGESFWGGILEEMRSVLSSIKTEYRVNGLKNEKKISGLFLKAHELIEFGAEDPPPCVGNSASSANLLESAKECDRSRAILMARLQRDAGISLEKLQRVIFDFEDCLSDGRKIQDFGESFDEALASVEQALRARRNDRIGKTEESSNWQSEESDSSFEITMNILNETSGEFKPPKINVSLAVDILKRVVETSEESAADFARRILDFKENGTHLADPFNGPPALVGLYWFIEFANDLMRLEDLFYKTRARAEHRVMTFAYWGAFNGFSKLPSSFATPFFDNASDKTLSELDKMFLRDYCEDLHLSEIPEPENKEVARVKTPADSGDEELKNQDSELDSLGKDERTEEDSPKNSEEPVSRSEEIPPAEEKPADETVESDSTDEENTRKDESSPEPEGGGDAKEPNKAETLTFLDDLEVSENQA